MIRSTSPPSVPGSDEQEVYTLKGASSHMGQRTAQKQGQFFLPQLHANMSLLDCGCGPGSITCGLAQSVAPGEVAGIDINPDDVELAQALAAEQGLSNLRFETASVYELPFGDGSFDAVFSHSLLEHLRHPLNALKEMYRVLNSGGVIGVRAPDFQGHFIAPPEPLVDRMWEFYERLSIHNGGNPRIGKHLRTLLREAGFAQIESSASYELWTKSQSQLVESGRKFANTFVELGLTTHEEFERMIDAAKAWQDHPDMLNAMAFCEAVGWKQ